MSNASTNPGEPVHPGETVDPSSPEQPEPSPAQPEERRFTAPSPSDAGATQIIDTGPPTEILSVTDAPAAAGAPTERFAVPPVVTPQLIPPRVSPARPAARRRSWGWVIALVLVIAALAAVAVLGTVLLTRNDSASGLGVVAPVSSALTR